MRAACVWCRCAYLTPPPVVVCSFMSTFLGRENGSNVARATLSMRAEKKREQSKATAAVSAATPSTVAASAKHTLRDIASSSAAATDVAARRNTVSLPSDVSVGVHVVPQQRKLDVCV